MSLYIFDMGEVLLLGVNVLGRLADEYGLDYAEFRKDYANYARPLDEGYMDPNDYYRHLEDRFMIRIADDPFAAFFDPVYNHPVLEMVDQLRSRGERCVIGSNTFKPHWDMLNGRYSELAGHFDEPGQGGKGKAQK